MCEAAQCIGDAPEVWGNVITLAEWVGLTEALLSALDSLVAL